LSASGLSNNNPPRNHICCGSTGFAFGVGSDGVEDLPSVAKDGVVNATTSNATRLLENSRKPSMKKRL